MIASPTPDFEGIDWMFDDVARELSDLARVDFDEPWVELPGFDESESITDDEIWRAASDMDQLSAW
jgi:hypothetical protein